METRKSSKDSMSSLFNRYVWLTDLIYRRGKISFEEINEQWINSDLNYSGDDLPLKTFHNHRHAIEDMFDIIIECDRRNGYVYYIENTEDMERGGVRQWLINTFAVNNLINESHKLKHRILFEKIPSGQRYLSAIIEAMRDGIVLEMSYQGITEDEPRVVRVEPYAVKVFKQRWYLVGRNIAADGNKKNEGAGEEIAIGGDGLKPEEGRGDVFRIYSLDRIHELQRGEGTFVMQEDFDAEAYFYNSYGIFNDCRVAPTQVMIKAKGVKARFIEFLPLHHSQKVESKGEDYTIYSYFLSPTFDFRQELLSHMTDLEVLSPDWFRVEVRDVINEQFKIYNAECEDDLYIKEL